MGWERGKAGAGESQSEFCRTQPRHDGRVGWQNAGESTSLGEPPEVEPAARHRHCPWSGWKKSNGTGWTALPRMAVPCMPVSIPSLVGLGFQDLFGRSPSHSGVWWRRSIHQLSVLVSATTRSPRTYHCSLMTELSVSSLVPPICLPSRGQKDQLKCQL